MSEDPILLSVQNLVKHFPIMRGIIFERQVGAVHAVDDFSLDVRRGETLGLVGESGSGKTTVGRTILQFYRPDSGHVYFEGTDLVGMKGEELRRIRRKMQMIFQDPYASLDPRMTVADIISEPLTAHQLTDRKEAGKKVEELLNLVGLNPAYIHRYPHEFSGGQRQRIGIARAIAMQPSLVICDEPISALDVSIQAQVVNLLEDLQDRFNLTYIFIAHDLSMVRHISDRVAVMYLGVIMELAGREELYNNSLHPYTQALLSAVPIPDPPLERKRHRIILQGSIPSPVNPPSGCRFRTRCPIAMPTCAEEKPAFREVSPGHFVACHAVP
jgi:oligopeptide transport system ATP-binding protein